MCFMSGIMSPYTEKSLALFAVAVGARGRFMERAELDKPAQNHRFAVLPFLPPFSSIISFSSQTSFQTKK